MIDHRPYHDSVEWGYLTITVPVWARLEDSQVGGNRGKAIV